MGDLSAAAPFDRVWHWRCNLPERKSTRCRILARGTMNSCLVEFEDGVRHVVSRYAVRKMREIDRTGELRGAVAGGV